MRPINAISDNRVQLDTVIVGGGITGLWLLNVLRARGYSAVLLEAQGLGGVQTLASQGVIHGGLKYALGGATTAASEALSEAPRRWRNCLAGHGEVDLSGLKPSSDCFHLFAGSGAVARLAGFFASQALRGRVERLGPRDFPQALQDAAFQGVVYRLEDFVLDTPALIARLAALASGGMYRHRLTPETCILVAPVNGAASQTSPADSPTVRREQRQSPADSNPPPQPGGDCDGAWVPAHRQGGVRIRLADQELLANRLIMAAGGGNEALMRGLGIARAPMQRRPLHQVIVRHPDLPPLFGHWLGEGIRAEPDLTITSHYGANPSDPPQPAVAEPACRPGDDWQARSGRPLWCLGGRLATSGEGRSEGSQIQRAKAALASCLPWIGWHDADFATFRIDRAEPRQPAGLRPNHAFVQAFGPCIICWPTKLSLVPDLADRVVRLLPPPQFADRGPLRLPAAKVAQPPWDT